MNAMIRKLIAESMFARSIEGKGAKWQSFVAVGKDSKDSSRLV